MKPANWFLLLALLLAQMSLDAAMPVLHGLAKNGARAGRISVGVSITLLSLEVIFSRFS